MAKRRDTSLIEALCLFVAIVLMIGGSIWVYTAAPCSLLGSMPAKNVPARCLMHR
jgi:hypothetical protein